MSSISIRIISHLSRSRALTQPIPTRYDCCCFHSLGGEEEVVRRPHRRGSGPACGRVLRKRRERVQARFLLRGGDSGAGPQRVIKGSQPTQRNTLGLARGSAPSNPDRGKFSPAPITPAAFRGCFRPQRRGLRPLRERRCGCRSHAPPGRATGVSSVARWSVYTALTPRGGNRRSFQPRTRPPFPPPPGRPYPRPHRGRRCVRPCPSPRIRELCRVGCRFQAPGIPEYPGTPPAPISLSGTVGPAACGESGMAGSLRGRHSVGANRPDRATKSQRNRFFYEGHNGGQDTVWNSLSPLYKMRYITFR